MSQPMNQLGERPKQILTALIWTLVCLLLVAGITAIAAIITLIVGAVL